MPWSQDHRHEQSGLNGLVDLLHPAWHLGADEVLVKPFNQATALAPIRRVVAPAPAALRQWRCASKV